MSRQGRFTAVPALVVAVLFGSMTLVATAGAAVRVPASTSAAAVSAWGRATPVAGVHPHSAPLELPPGRNAHASGSHVDAVSSNWSGYIATGSTFTRVSAQWRVPAVAPAAGVQASATWIGIDGATNRSLIQTGTAQNSFNGRTGYYAWYEILPAPPVEVGVVQAGDTMSASIVKGTGGRWVISIADISTHNSASGAFPYTGPGASAEWIEEAPTSSQTNQVVTLADFGVARFSDLGVDAADPGAVGVTPVRMVDGSGRVIAVPGPLSGGAFTVAYQGPSPTAHPGHGYDLVGRDGGVFVFGGGYYGSLPGLGVEVDDITGIVATATHTGYFLVGSDGGVFAFHAHFANSLPGIGVHVDDIVGIVPTRDDQGYFLVGRDGGVFSFNAPFANSLPGVGVHVDDITGIAATPDDNGYWLVGSDGSVYAFGDARFRGSAPAGAVAITATHDGGGYWVVGADGSVTAFGDAGTYGDLPGLGVGVDDIVGIVVSEDSKGYNLIGRDGGVFSFGDATNTGSLPGLGVSVDDIVGAVPT